MCYDTIPVIETPLHHVGVVATLDRHGQQSAVDRSSLASKENHCVGRSLRARVLPLRGGTEWSRPCGRPMRRPPWGRTVGSRWARRDIMSFFHSRSSRVSASHEDRRGSFLHLPIITRVLRMKKKSMVSTVSHQRSTPCHESLKRTRSRSTAGPVRGMMVTCSLPSTATHLLVPRATHRAPWS
jgi:hypothetical protein